MTDGYALDALVAYQLYANGRTDADLDVILGRTGGLHAASWFFAEGGQHASSSWTMIRMQRAGEALNVSNVRTGARTRAGTLKVDNKRNVAANILTSLGTLATPALWAFGCGDIEQIRSLLGDVRHVGRKRSAGFGAVEAVDVEQIGGWPEIGIADPDGQPLRAIPVDAWKGNDAPLGAYTLSFPRWVQKPQPCVYPPDVIIERGRLEAWVRDAGGGAEVRQ
jgi:hypothetical protein